MQVVWPALEEEFGWTKVHGPRMHDVYFLPKGVARGQNGAKCRVDYYDSNRQVRMGRAVMARKERRCGEGRARYCLGCPRTLLCARFCAERGIAGIFRNFVIFNR